jgi:hypothetical protein
MKTLWKSGCEALKISFLMTGIFSVVTACLASNYSVDPAACLIFFSFMLTVNLLTQAKNYFSPSTKQNLTPSC